MDQFSPQRIIFVLPWVTLLLLISDRRMDASQSGPPEPTADKGKVSLGVGYFRFAGKLYPENPDRFVGLVRQHKIKQNQFYLQASYGFLKDWETYLRVGSSDLRLDGAFPFASRDIFNFSADFEGGFKPFGTLGLKGLLYDSIYFGIGPFFQASVFSNHKDKAFYFGPNACQIFGGEACILVILEGSQELKIRYPWEVNLGIGLQTKVHGITLYGGPFAYWAGYKAEYKLNGVPVNQTHYREKNNFGGFVGLKAPVPWIEGLSLDAEGQFRNKGSGGISLSYLF